MDDTDTNRVGYGRPPKQHQFKPGHSGNPKGRPKGAKSLKGHMKRLMEQKIAVSDASGTRQVTRKQAVAMRVVEQAMRGDAKSIQLLISMDAQSEIDDRKSANELTPSEAQMLDELFTDQKGEYKDE